MIRAQVSDGGRVYVEVEDEGSSWALADLRAALDMLVKAAGSGGPDAAGAPGPPGLSDVREGSATR